MAVSRACTGRTILKRLAIAAAGVFLLSGYGGCRKAAAPPAAEASRSAPGSTAKSGGGASSGPAAASPARSPASEAPAAKAESAAPRAPESSGEYKTPQYYEYKPEYKLEKRAEAPKSGTELAVKPPPPAMVRARPPEVEIPPPSSATPYPSVPAFQWPPPRASAEYVLPRSIFGDDSRAMTFSDADRVLVAALDAGGYSARNYYSVPHGFALATRIEQINDDGSPKMPPARFALEPEPVSILRPLDYLKALLRGVPGYYRVIVFILTDTPFQASGEQPTEAQATAWVSSGLNVLPREIGALPFTRDVNCTALVYEFLRKSGADADATEFAMPGRLDAMTHLVKSGIWRGFHAP